MEVPWPWNGIPPKSPLKSLIRQSPPQPIVLTSVPLLTVGGAPGMNISTVASQVPASIASTLCSGPGIGGCWAAAEPESATRRDGRQRQPFEDLDLHRDLLWLSTILSPSRDGGKRESRRKACEPRARQGLPRVRLLGQRRPRQGRSPARRPGGRPTARAASRDRRRQPLHGRRLRRPRRGGAASRGAATGGARARRLARVDAARLPLLHALQPPAGDPECRRDRAGAARPRREPERLLPRLRRPVHRARRRGRRGRAAGAAPAPGRGALRAAARARGGAVRRPGALQHPLQRRRALVAEARPLPHAAGRAGRGLARPRLAHVRHGPLRVGRALPALDRDREGRPDARRVGARARREPERRGRARPALLEAQPL